jgi:hypothetical protein
MIEDGFSLSKLCDGRGENVAGPPPGAMSPCRRMHTIVTPPFIKHQLSPSPALQQGSLTKSWQHWPRHLSSNGRASAFNQRADAEPNRRRVPSDAGSILWLEPVETRAKP